MNQVQKTKTENLLPKRTHWENRGIFGINWNLYALDVNAQNSIIFSNLSLNLQVE